jgi:hypothetical protein
MARPKLTRDQRETLLKWISADYETGLIIKWAKEDPNWPPIDRDDLKYYRKKYGINIEVLRKMRRDSALNEGLALKEERVRRLSEHADALEAIKWVPDEHGRLWNEKAWRETLADIAAETGGRKQNVDITTGGEKIKGYAIFSPDDWDKDATDSTIQTAPVADSPSEG